MCGPSPRITFLEDAHETLYLLAFAGLLSRARRDAAERPPDREGLARPAQGRSVRAGLSETQSRGRGADVDRRRRAAARALARDTRISRREVSAAADPAEGLECTGACARDRPDGRDGRAPVHGAARAQISRAGVGPQRAEASGVDTALGRSREQGG